jgi:hypothetical protein
MSFRIQNSIGGGSKERATGSPLHRGKLIVYTRFPPPYTPTFFPPYNTARVFLIDSDLMNSRARRCGFCAAFLRARYKQIQTFSTV